MKAQHPALSKMLRVIPPLIIGVMAAILVACAGSSTDSTSPAVQAPTAQAPATQEKATQPAAAALPSTSGIKGTVQETQTGKKIASAYLVFKSEDGAIRKDTFADADGNYQIELPKGRYQVTASQPGYVTKTSDNPIENSGAGYITAPITLDPKSEPAAAANATVNANCAGTEFKGFCWYMGDEKLSCEAVCSTHGGYSEGTLSVAGSGGSDTNCSDALAKVGVVLHWATVDEINI